MDARGSGSDGGRASVASTSARRVAPAGGERSGASASTARSVGPLSEMYFGTLASGRMRFSALVVAAIGVFGALAWPLATSGGIRTFVAASLLALALSVAAVLLTARAHDRRRYDVAMLCATVSSALVVLFLDPIGPTPGALAMVLILHNFDAPPRTRIATTATVAATAVGGHILITLGLVPRLGILQSVPDPLVESSNILTTAIIYAGAYALPVVYRKQTAAHLAELAEAGREIAARNALLREARLDLERVVKVGGRGRFTDQRLGSFVLGSVLGRGGMGEVYEAVHAETGAPAAVKLLRPSGEDSLDALHRFVRESALIRALESPHVVALLEVGGMEAPLPYIAMERLEGEDLATILRRGRPSVTEVEDMVRQIADGLLVARARDIVHRDIKPSNLFRTKAGVWKILDFGVSRLAGQSGTLTGDALVGTVGFLAPEQLDLGGAVSHATDVHALGVVAYRALTGRPAFVERAPAEVLREVAELLPVRPSHYGVPPAFDDVLAIALAKAPEERFADAGELADAFAAAAIGERRPDLAARAAALQERLPWRESRGSRPPRAVASRPEPTARTTPVAPAKPAPDEVVEPVTVAETRPAAPAPGAPAPAVTLVSGSTDELVRSMLFARARVVVPLLVIGVVFAFTQLPLNRRPGMLLFGAVSTAILTVELVAIALLSASPRRDAKRFDALVLLTFATSLTLVYFFQVGGIVTPFIGIALLVVTFGAPPAGAALALLIVAVPHALLHLAVTFGVLEDRGIFDLRAGTPARLLNLAQVIFVYLAAFGLGRIVRERSAATLRDVADAFRRLAEREALLEDARRELERAVGVGQPGRFTGQEIGRYRLGHVLGRGGMGEVYEASARSGAPVAVKVVHRAGGGPDTVARFEREAAIMTAVASPHVVRVVETGRDAAGLPFIAMERLHGKDLGILLQQRLALAPAEVLTMVEEIAAGLAAAHAAGVVHLDVKPQNVFLTDDGRWKLLDFGVAALAEEPGAEESSVAGTPAFMAPEQLSGRRAALDARTDIHALAAIAYRALTGRPTFSGQDGAAVVREVLESLPDRPSEIVNVPRAVDAVLRVALAKTPDARFADVRAFAAALRGALADEIEPALLARAGRLGEELPWGTKARRASSARD